ncbi:MAG TPA: AAA family ATPase, partial [Anaeromyxobacteraceae bacterium]|nr:AAA family ATPase [Anaeromyxobacteraceae bacterium]
MRIRLLGGFTVGLGELEVPSDRWPTARAAQLVQLLCLAEGHRLPREQVIEALWPQLGPQAGGANLRKAAHHARLAVGAADAVVLQGGQVLLFPGRERSVDAECFQQVARDALASDDSEACARAADAYGGELLPAAAYETWAEAPRLRLRSLYLSVLRAGGLWERLAEAEPGDEPAHRELMRRALAAGNRPAAIRWYARLRTDLQALGVTPDRRTMAVYEECVAELRPAAAPFVGRQAELARVAAWLRESAAERAGGLLVRGPAGIGKTAFGRELAGLALEQGWGVVSIAAAQASRPYAVVTEAVEQLIAADRSLLERIGAPARAVLAQLTALAAPGEPLQGPLGRHQVVGALRRTLLAASPRAPVMVLADDAHLMEEADFDALLQLASSGPPTHVVLMMRALPEGAPLARRLARSVAACGLLAIELGGLHDEEARRLAESVPGDLAGALVEHVIRRAEGNPFAVLELARSARSDTGARLPSDVREAIGARLCDVSEATLALLQRLALAA